jgi:NADH dehydrogenase
MEATNGHVQVVTGSFGFSGKYLTRRLLAEGVRVRTLTNSMDRANPFQGQVEVHPYNFDHPAALVESLKGAEILYNTYWVRFNHQAFQHETAVHNAEALFAAAKEAGIRRIVHISITNPSETSPLEYFSGKARMEKALLATGIPYSILRPAVLFGREDILINNIAWALRHLPVFGLFGDGSYRIQPIYVDDLAGLMQEHGKRSDSIILDAIGPETFTYRGLVNAIGEIIGHRRPIVAMPPSLAYAAGKVLGTLMGDVMITKQEVEGLMADLLHVDSTPLGTTRLTEWAVEYRDRLGRHYASELKRRLDRKMAIPSM